MGPVSLSVTHTKRQTKVLFTRNFYLLLLGIHCHLIGIGQETLALTDQMGVVLKSYLDESGVKSI